MVEVVGVVVEQAESVQMESVSSSPVTAKQEEVGINETVVRIVKKQNEAKRKALLRKKKRKEIEETPLLLRLRKTYLDFL